MTKRKNAYPALYRWAYATGRETELVPLHEQQTIPKQTKSNWRNLPYFDLKVLEDELRIKEKVEGLLEKEDLDWVRKKRLFITITKLHFKTIRFLGREKYLKLLASRKEEFISLIEEFSIVFPKKELLKWFQISINKYQIWYTQSKFDCLSSTAKLCAKKHPYQITNKEFHIIEKCLQDPIFTNWPKSAIHSDLLKRGVLHISRSTFYKHAKIIQPNVHRKKGKRPQYSPLRATYVNEFWHMDISYFRTSDGQRSFIYGIIDNYSRKIIAWRCETYISKHIVGEVICEALQKVSITKLNLVSDGGTENTNHHIQHLLVQFHEQNGIDIDHKIALKTIQQSNSMIERFFRIMKSNYLYLDTPFSHSELCMAMEKIIHDYNYVRPHYALNHLTPNECFMGVNPLDVSKQIKRAKKQRFKKNKNCSCTVCIC